MRRVSVAGEPRLVDRADELAGDQQAPGRGVDERRRATGRHGRASRRRRSCRRSARRASPRRECAAAPRPGTSARRPPGWRARIRASAPAPAPPSGVRAGPRSAFAPSPAPGRRSAPAARRRATGPADFRLGRAIGASIAARRPSWRTSSAAKAENGRTATVRGFGRASAREGIPAGGHTDIPGYCERPRGIYTWIAAPLKEAAKGLPRRRAAGGKSPASTILWTEPLFYCCSAPYLLVGNI